MLARARMLSLAMSVVALAQGFVPTLSRASATAPAAGVAVPGGPAALAEAAGLATTPDRSLLMLEVIRTLYHESLDGPSPAALAARARVRAAFDRPGARADVADLVPLPLGATAWTRDILRAPLAETAIVPAILADRRASLFYYGVSAMDAESRAWLAADPERLARLYQRHAESWPVYARSLHIAGGRLRLPGGAAGAQLWPMLVDASPDDPEAFIDKLATRSDGRLAWLFDVVAHLPSAVQQHVLGADLESTHARLGRARAVAEVFTKVGVGWRVRERPLWRPLVDPSLFLFELSAADGGRLAEPRDRAFWTALFASDALPSQPDPDDPPEKEDPRQPEGAGQEADAGFLLARVFLDHPPAQRDRLEQTLFVQRMARTTGAPPAISGEADLLTIGRGFVRYRALALSLERMGLTDARVMATALRRARRVTRGDEEGVVTFQALLALVERVRLARAIDVSQASTLVSSLAAAPFGETRPASTLAADWLTATLLPSLPARADSREAQVLAAMAGVGAATAARRLADVIWEGQTYQVDAAAAERARLEAVRSAQGTPTLDEAVALVRAAGDLRRPGAAGFDAAMESVEPVASRFSQHDPIRTPGRGAAASALSARAADSRERLPRVHEAISKAAGKGGRATAARDAARVGRLLEPVAGQVLEEVLTALVYAASLPASRVELSEGRADLRHDLGLDAKAAQERARRPWSLAEAHSGSGVPWRLRGSLLSLDLALGPFLLPRISDEAPAPTLNGSDRQVFLRSVALVNPGDLRDEDRDRLVAAIAAGRTRAATLLADADGLAEVAVRVGLSEWRVQALAWARVHDPASIAHALSLAELCRLGLNDDEIDRLAAWGASLVEVTGQWATRLPPARAWEDLVGHSGSGLLATQVADLNIRTAQWLAGAHLPASLARGVLALAVPELVDKAPAAHPDDWRAVVDYVRLLPASRFEDYLAALTVDGPLRPAAPGGEIR